MARYFLIVVIMLFNVCFANVFSSPKSVEYIISKMPELKDVSCKFVQDKYIPSNNVHLISKGNFVFNKKSGITFYVTYPVTSTISYNSNEYKQINDIIKAIASKNYSKLESNFDFYYIENKNNWTLGLKPKLNSKLKNALVSLEIFGNNDISKIIITPNNGVITKIDFYK